MADPDLRTLERRWRSTGSAEDEAAYLAARLKVGDIGRDQLELAAHCGHEPASQALGHQSSNRSADLRDWLECLEAWGRCTIVQAGLAIVEELLPTFEAEPGAACVRDSVLAASDWCCCPCNEHAAQAEEQSGVAFMLANETYHSTDQVAFLLTQLAAATCLAVKIDVADSSAMASHYADLLAAAIGGHARFKDAVAARLIPIALAEKAMAPCKTQQTAE